MLYSRFCGADFFSTFGDVDGFETPNYVTLSSKKRPTASQTSETAR